jgi:hypothetical protein
VIDNPRIASLTPANLLAMWRGPGSILVNHRVQRSFSGPPHDPLRRLTTMLAVVPAYLRTAFFPTSLAAIYAMAERERFTEEDSKRRFTTLSVRQRSTRNAPRRFSTSGRFTGSSGTTRPVHDGRWREA